MQRVSTMSRRDRMEATREEKLVAASANKTGSMNSRDRSGSSRHVYWVVAVVAILTHAFSFLATPLWVYPDSIDYIELAGGIVSRGDWSNELFLIRPPGYPILLAIVFKLFGEASPVALQVLQHAMGIGLALLTVALSLRVTTRRSVALIAGILCCLSLQVLAYCNMPLTEIPFTLAFTGATYFLVRYWQSPNWKLLLLCSLLAGVGYVIKPVGVIFFGVAAIVLCARAWFDLRNDHALSELRFTERMGAFARRSCLSLGVAAIPLVVVTGPWMLQSADLYSANGTIRCVNYLLYLRPLEFDRLDTTETKSAAMRDIKSVVAEAIDRGLIDSDASFRDRLTVINSYKRVRGLSFTEATKMLGQAGKDVMLEHPMSIAINTVKYAAWMLLSPDPVYRFVPGGAAGIKGQRDSEAEFYNLSTYSVGADSWESTLEQHAGYLPLSITGGAWTDSWKSMKSFFRSRIDRGPSPIGMRDSLYEEFMLLCFLGGMFLVFVRRNEAAMILFALLLTYIGISSFFGASQTRYVVVIKPILFLGAGVSIVAVADGVAMLFRRIFWRKSVSSNVHRKVPETA